MAYKLYSVPECYRRVTKEETGVRISLPCGFVLDVQTRLPGIQCYAESALMLKSSDKYAERKMGIVYCLEYEYDVLRFSTAEELKDHVIHMQSELDGCELVEGDTFRLRDGKTFEAKGDMTPLPDEDETEPAESETE